MLMLRWWSGVWYTLSTDDGQELSPGFLEVPMHGTYNVDSRYSRN